MTPERRDPKGQAGSNIQAIDALVVFEKRSCGWQHCGACQSRPCNPGPTARCPTKRATTDGGRAVGRGTLPAEEGGTVTSAASRFVYRLVDAKNALVCPNRLSELVEVSRG